MSWLLAFVGFSLLIVLHELGHFFAAKAVGMRVERFSLFFPPLLLRKKYGETEYAIGSIPLGGYVKITGMSPSEDLPDEVRTRAYTAQPVWKRVVVIAAGPAVNLLLALLLLFVFFWAIGPRELTDRVGTPQPGSPAAEKLRPGDRLVAVDGVRGDQQTLRDAIGRHHCPGPQVDGCRAATPASVRIDRAGRPLQLWITPEYNAAAERPLLGFSYAAGERVPYPFGEAADVAVDRFWFITKETLKLPARLFNAEQRKEISGVVGSYEVTRQTIIEDLASVVGILAIISLSLGLINLFPFLPLDGGHIFWAIVEKVRRRPVPFSVMERSGVIGFALVMVLFIIGFTNDIDRLTSGEGFSTR